MVSDIGEEGVGAVIVKGQHQHLIGHRYPHGWPNLLQSGDKVSCLVRIASGGENHESLKRNGRYQMLSSHITRPVGFVRTIINLEGREERKLKVQFTIRYRVSAESLYSDTMGSTEVLQDYRGGLISGDNAPFKMYH